MKRSIKTNIMVLLTFITLVTSSIGVTPAYAVEDTTPPQASVDFGPYHPTRETTATFYFSATDDLTIAPNFTFWCDLDGLGWEDCSSDPGEWFYNGLAEGWHIFTLYAIDEAGNESDFVYWDWFVDLTPPDVYFEAVPPKITTQTDAEFEIWATDNFSGDKLANITNFWGLNFFCKLDDGAWDVCEFYMPLQLYYNGLASGEHTLYLDTYDEAGNLTSISYSWCVNFCTAKEPTTNWIAPNGLPQGVSMREQHLTSFTEFNTWINGKAYKLAPPKPWLLFAGAAVQLDSTVPLKKPVKICFYYPKASYTEGKWTGKIYFLDGTKWIGRSTTQEVVDGFPYLCTNATQPGIYIVVDGWAK